jgi:protein-disulfide isomerase
MIPASRRVYTIVLGLTIGAAMLGIGCRAPSPGAQDRLTISTAMVKGPATAPVTIVEFSDYQ